MNKNKFNFFENAWSKKTRDYEDMTGKNVAEIKKQKRINTVIGVFSLLFAFIIWTYACSVSQTELKLQTESVTVKRVSLVESKGYTVEYNAGIKVNYTVKGTVFAISQIPKKGLDVYADLSTVNLSEITDMKIIQLPLLVDLPADISCTEKSHEYIEVIITKKISNNIK